MKQNIVVSIDLGATNTRVMAFSRQAGIVARSALKSLAYQTHDVVSKFAAVMRRLLKVLRVDGGATQNEFLMQFQAGILNLPVKKPK